MAIKVDSVRDFFVLILVLLWEHWLGHTKKTEAASTIDLVLFSIKNLVSNPKEMAMKPFDLKLLVEALKAQGLPLAEDVAKNVVEVVFKWTEDSVKLSPTPYDDFALPLLQSAKAFVLAEIDKIDGQIGVPASEPVV